MVKVVLVALFRYQNFPVRLLHPLLVKIPGVVPFSVFLKDCPTNYFNYPTEKEIELFLGLIDGIKPDIVSFTVLSPFANVAKKLTLLIKQRHPKTVIIWGGIHPTIFPDDCIKEADIICVGEGEGALADLVVAIRDGKTYSSINNLWINRRFITNPLRPHIKTLDAHLWINNDAGIIKNPMRPLIQNLDALPFPLYGGGTYYFIDNNEVTLTDPLLSESNYFIQTSRGCPWKCNFCVNSLLKPLFKDLGPYVRRRTVGSVISELSQHLTRSKGKMKSVFFIDDVFAIDKKWVDEFVVKYPSEIGLPFFVEYHPKHLNEELLDKLEAAGLSEVDIGIQSGSDIVRNQIYNRSGTNVEIIRLAKEVVKRGIIVRYDLILDSPYDGVKELKETISLLLELPKPLRFNLFSMQWFPDYPLTKRAINDGYINSEDASIETLMNATGKNWAYLPRLFPFNDIQILKNIIWLIVWNHASDEQIKQASSSKSMLHYLNLKSIIYGRLFGVGRPVIISYAMSAMEYIRNGNYKMLVEKAKERIF